MNTRMNIRYVYISPKCNVEISKSEWSSDFKRLFMIVYLLCLRRVLLTLTPSVKSILLNPLGFSVSECNFVREIKHRLPSSVQQTTSSRKLNTSNRNYVKNQRSTPNTDWFYFHFMFGVRSDFCFKINTNTNTNTEREITQCIFKVITGKCNNTFPE